MSHTFALARHAAELAFEALPPAVVAKARQNILDTLGVIVRGARTTHAMNVFSTVKLFGGAPQAAVLGRSERVSMVQAALLNGIAGHGIELDDAHTFVHPGAAVVPAALSVCEYHKRSGRDFLTAVVAGYDVSVRVSQAAGVYHRKRFHPTGTCNTFGCAAAAARALGLDARMTEGALGVAGCQSSATCQFRADGSANKHLHAGLSAEGGVFAAFLAQSGFAATTAMLDGEFGFLNMMSDGGEPDKLIADLGVVFSISGTDIKPYPSCRQTHGALDLVFEALRKGLDPAGICQLRIEIYEYATSGWFAANTPPDSALKGMLNIPFSVASALHAGKLNLDSFEGDALHNPDVLALAAKIVVAPDPAFTAVFPEKRSVRLRFVMEDGSEHVFETANPKGGADSPLTMADVEKKFCDLVEDIMGKAGTQKALDMVCSLEKLADVTELVEAFRLDYP